MATIEFCRKTLCLTKTLDPEAADGTTTAIDLFPDTGSQIIKIKAIAVDGKLWPIVTAAHGHELARSGSTADFAFQTGLSTIEIHPMQAAGTSIVVDAAIAPTMSATTCANELVPYTQDIALCAIASLQMIPNQTFSNPQHASVSQAGFNTRVSTVAAKMARGQAAAKMSSRTTSFI